MVDALITDIFCEIYITPRHGRNSAPPSSRLSQDLTLMSTVRPLLLTLVLLPACKPEDASLLAEVEDGEWLPGGETTNTLMLGANAYLLPAPNLDGDNESLFYSGNSSFNQSWLEAPSDSENIDGLGPLFNASSCSSCHFKDGRAAPPAGPDDDVMGTLVRLSVPGAADGEAPHGDPIYGGQLQDQGLADVPAEGRPEIEWEEFTGEYPDGEVYTLRRPLLTISELAYGDLDPEVRTGIRVAPAMIGLGLLEAIDAADLEALEDPEDTDGDGISGERNWVWDPVSGEMATGRFGWRAEQPTVLAQSTGAFAGDMGLTSWVVSGDDCTEGQPECLESASGGEPEIDEDIVERINVYSSTLAVPVRRNWEDETVLRGKKLFTELNCSGCHVPSFTTGPHSIDALADQKIWPYTDLLLHDMGEGLADGHASWKASGAEWRTAPLWGLGLIPDVNGHLELLHDGRARGFAEAILWHGGEGEESREGFMALSSLDRDAVVAFLETL